MRRASSLVAFLWVSVTVNLACGASQVSFSQQIQPILARKCFSCHGPDEEHRAADLRLDQRDAAIDAGAIALEDLADSELLRRIYSDDPEEQMPPPSSQESLTDDERKLIDQWINSGAPYEQHWAFIAPQQPTLPLEHKREVSDSFTEPSGSDQRRSSTENHSVTTSSVRNPIDAFVHDRLHQRHLQPASTADRYSLVRRLYLDLTGLPPTPAEADDFVADHRPDAYEQLVDRLLASPHYGERWARLWLDLARYADTNGYEKDRSRSIWPYRDWVVNAMNADLPFDQFTIEQLAGDLLPDPTLDQKIATGFHRNTMLNEEGGIDPLEFRYYAMVDRVATTGTVWLGLTISCAQCHSHKYDPISHTDYYRLFALLNNADEPDLVVSDRSVVQQRKRIQSQIDRLEADLRHLFPARWRAAHGAKSAGELGTSLRRLAERAASSSRSLDRVAPRQLADQFAAS